jgi:ribonuclease T2
MKINKALFVLIFSILLAFSSQAAAESVSGTFKAVSACDAYKSFNKGANPGRIKTTPGKEYDLVEANNKNMEWVRIHIPGIKEPLRWVSGECGTKDLEGGRPDESGDNKPIACSTKNQHDSYVLALTWQPGFCKHYKYKGKKPECDAIKDGSLVVDHLTLHGLWPNRKACGTSYGNCNGPKLDLEESTVSQLAPWMPNFLYDDEQTFGAYEWNKHGTCQNLSDDEYFLTALKLVEAVDRSAVGSYIKDSAGSSMSVNEFFAKVKSAYGQEVADRITLVCAGGKYLQEVRVNLPLNFKADSNLAVMTKGAAKTGARKINCDGDSVYVEPGCSN